jgi:hypothetical protein
LNLVHFPSSNVSFIAFIFSQRKREGQLVQLFFRVISIKITLSLQVPLPLPEALSLAFSLSQKEQGWRSKGGRAPQWGPGPGPRMMHCKNVVRVGMDFASCSAKQGLLIHPC